MQGVPWEPCHCHSAHASKPNTRAASGGEARLLIFREVEERVGPEAKLRALIKNLLLALRADEDGDLRH